MAVADVLGIEGYASLRATGFLKTQVGGLGTGFINAIGTGKEFTGKDFLTGLVPILRTGASISDIKMACK